MTIKLFQHCSFICLVYGIGCILLLSFSQIHWSLFGAFFPWKFSTILKSFKVPFKVFARQYRLSGSSTQHLIFSFTWETHAQKVQIYSNQRNTSGSSVCLLLGANIFLLNRLARVYTTLLNLIWNSSCWSQSFPNEVIKQSVFILIGLLFRLLVRY